MAKAYWIAHNDVHDPELYKEYQEKSAAAFKRHNARFLVRGGEMDAKGGHWNPRMVVIEFDSLADARACHDSPDYQEAAAIRKRASTGDMVLVEGAA